jgi:hypothetical protein
MTAYPRTAIHPAAIALNALSMVATFNHQVTAHARARECRIHSK